MADILSDGDGCYYKVSNLFGELFFRFIVIKLLKFVPVDNDDIYR